MKRRKKRLISGLSVIILALSMFLSPTASTFALSTSQDSSRPISSLKDVKNNVTKTVGPLSKVESKLLDQFEKEEKITFLVKFKDKVDTAKVAQEAVQKAQAQKLTPYKTELLKRSSIVSELRATAMKSQAQVLEFVEEQEEKGNAKLESTLFIVNAIGVTATKDVMEKIAQFEEVVEIVPNEIRATIEKVDVTEQVEQMEAVENAVNAVTESVEWGVERVGAPAVWNMGIDGTGVVVANIDSGVQWDHPALKNKYRGYNPETGEVNHVGNWFDSYLGTTTPNDPDGHGTHTMGTMVGGTPDGSNQIGVAPGAKWIAVNAFGPLGATDLDLFEAGQWILAPIDANGQPNAELAPDVVSNSWSSGTPGRDDWYREMVEAWRNSDIVPVFSAGNTRPGTNPGGPGSVPDPGNYPESFSVGATDINDELASFSLRGPSPYGEIKPDVSAPGVNVRSSVPGGYANYNGTSMSAPHVAGAIALLLQADSSLSVEDVENVLMHTADPITNAEYPESPNNGYGHGIVNAFNAVSSVATGLGKLKGQVTKDGEDTEPPTFEHQPISETYSGLDLELEIEVSDNINVESVKLEYNVDDNEWQTIDADLVTGNYLQGTYVAVIPGEEIDGESLSYKWKLNDYGNNEVISEEYNVTIKPGITHGYFQDFESTPVGWRSFGEANSWEWGVPTSGPENAASGEKVYATNLNGPYENYMNATLVTPPIDLPEGETYLQFKHWFEFEMSSTGRAWDYGHVVISTDGENWTQLVQVAGSSNGWEDAEVDLSEYAGQRVFIGFNAYSDVSIVRNGWYIDDVALSATSNQNAKFDVVKSYIPSNIDPETDKKEDGIDPSEVKPVPTKAESNEISTEKTTGLPLSAVVTILETERSVATSPRDGSYSLIHPAGDFTAVAEAYGFYSKTESVHIADGEETTVNFHLDPLPTGTVTGTVTNAQTGEFIEGATVYLVEDANVAPSVTGSDGTFSLTAYEGTYTLKVVAPFYSGNETTIHIEGNSEQTFDFELDPFIGYPGQIGYDDGVPENAIAWNSAGNGWAVKMSLENDAERALVTGGQFFFWDETWPNPGGTEFQVAVYDATGDGGLPGNLIAGPFDAEAIRDGVNWTNVDLSDKGIVVEGDFYMVYIQKYANPNTPGLALDESSDQGRSYEFFNGEFIPVGEGDFPGNFMIRATVEYEVPIPTITTPVDGSYTNQQVINLQGKTAPSIDVEIFNNGEEVARTTSDESGTFTAEITLTEGENTLSARATSERGFTAPSEEVTIVYDATNPELTIDSPADGSKSNREVLTVTGQVYDENLNQVTVNGTKATVSEGTYTAKLIADEGLNKITVIASDLAGNETVKEITVDVKYTAPEITNVKPDVDHRLKAGETVKIEFTSEPGLRATFVIHMPLTNLPNYTVNNVTELPLMEVSPGQYVGYYTATSNVVAEGAAVEVKAKDAYGNASSAIASGKLFINVPDDEEDDNGKGNGKGKGKGKGKGNGNGNGNGKGKDKGKGKGNGN